MQQNVREAKHSVQKPAEPAVAQKKEESETNIAQKIDSTGNCSKLKSDQNQVEARIHPTLAESIIITAPEQVLLKPAATD